MDVCFNLPQYVADRIPDWMRGGTGVKLPDGSIAISSPTHKPFDQLLCIESERLRNLPPPVLTVEGPL